MRSLLAAPVRAISRWARAPERLARLPPPPWPGDPARGSAILQGRLVCAGKVVDAARPVWSSPEYGPASLRELHSFSWLDDLAALGADAAKQRARHLIGEWLDAGARLPPTAHEPGTAGIRVAQWLAHARLISQGDQDPLSSRILAALAAQLAELAFIPLWSQAGSARLAALRGIIFGSLCGIGPASRARRALRLLRRELHRQFLPDGGHVERSPSVLLAAVAALVDIRDMLQLAEWPAMPELDDAIGRSSGLLRVLRHGDGGLALFNGSSEGRVQMTDAVLARAGTRTIAPDASSSGFQRLTGERTLVLMDTGPLPPEGHDQRAHAGTLSFEMSYARERVVVNCGGAAADDIAWELAQRSTAAHSTVIVDDTNSAEIRSDGVVGRRPSAVLVRRREDAGNIWIDASHDGYMPIFGLSHQRRLFLSADGEDLRGEDTLTGSHTGSFAARFHLHPDVTVSLIQSGGAALIRTLSGQAWRFMASGGKLELADSVYFGRPPEVRRSEQMVVSGPVSNGATIKWAFKRIKS